MSGVGERKWPKTLIRFCLLLFLPLISLGCAAYARFNLQPQGRMSYPGLHESSGVAVSQKYDGVLWTHNDAHNPAELFAIKENGRLIRKYKVDGAENNDWEDIALDEDGFIYILDNTSRADSKHRSTIYYLPEPNPFLDKDIRELRQFAVSFPDGGFDCEALFVWRGQMFLVTKPWDGSLPRIYTYDRLGQDGTATYLGEVPVYAMVTGGDISLDGSRIVLSSYASLIIFEGDGSPEELLRTEPLLSRLNAGEVEGVSWDDEDIVITNEQREIFRISRSDWEDDDALFVKSPKQKVPFALRKPAIQTQLENWSAGSWLKVRPQSGGEKIARAGGEKIGRVLWTGEGLHVGIQLPDGMGLRQLEHKTPPNYLDWFVPGSLYLLVNPNGVRPVAYGENDRCIILGRSPEGDVVAEARYLAPATFVKSSEVRPPWLRVEQEDRRLLITLTHQTPGLEQLYQDHSIGFNLLFVDQEGQLWSWATLTRRFSWDAPNAWGLLEIHH